MHEQQLMTKQSALPVTIYSIISQILSSTSKERQNNRIFQTHSNKLYSKSVIIQLFSIYQMNRSTNLSSFFTRVVHDKSNKFKTVRGLFWTILGYGSTQLIRLVSNLILARILFPEAFGLMALITSFMIALAMFSDFGINNSIIQNERGEDPDFLNTAWTIQIMRGVFLSIAASLLTIPLSNLYGYPLLAAMLPIASLSAIISGFLPTKMVTANRNLILGKLTVVEVSCQLCAVAIMIALALVTNSVWSLLIGGLSSDLFRLLLAHKVIPGPSNKLLLEKDAVKQIFNFGSWIFISTICGFIVNQSDRIILGKFLSLSELGIYNIAYLLSSVPFAIMVAMSSKVVFPLLSRADFSTNNATRKKTQTMRMILSSTMVILALLLSFLGPMLISALYDERYQAAGGLVILLSLSLIPLIVTNTSEQALLAVGDSKRFMICLVSLSVTQTIFVMLGVKYFGVGGAALSFGITRIITYPVIAWATYKHRAWMPLQDFTIVFVATVISIAIVTDNHASIMPLFTKVR